MIQRIFLTAFFSFLLVSLARSEIVVQYYPETNGTITGYTVDINNMSYYEVKRDITKKERELVAIDNQIYSLTNKRATLDIELTEIKTLFSTMVKPEDTSDNE